MRMGKELGSWLADKARQDGTMDAIRASARRFMDSPAMRRLQRELDEAGGADAILDAALTFLPEADAVEAVLIDLIRSTRADPFHRPPFRPVASPLHLGLLLVEEPRLSILLGVTMPDALAAKRLARTGPAAITFDGQRAVYRFLKAGGATFSFWESPPIDAGFTADASGRCRLVERRSIGDGEIVPLDGRCQSFIIDHAVSEIVYLKAATPVGAAPLAVQYDSDSLAFAGASGADEASARVQMMISLLRILDRQDAAPLIEEAVRHPHFYVRWHAMRELLALDAERALPGLRAMAEDDPHPEVRAAAAATLDDFFADGEAAKELEDDRCHA